jgi:bifunctional UDP-N-acetylglucosamine pyrophosphorylase/glucosamine-1-phosphate N-acetyltransferase
MDRLLIVPAAGRGSRLGVAGPKALAPVAGRPMLEHVLRRHRSSVNRFIVVVAPSATDAFAAFAAEQGAPMDLVVQPSPTGMLDAIMAASQLVERHRPRRVAVTWCDQIAVASATIERLSSRAMSSDAPALVLATLQVDSPYIHFERNEHSRIVGVRQRREGDSMPDSGETDMGLFDLSLDAYLRDLPLFASDAPTSTGTGERNFLPFIPWLARRAAVETVPGVAAIETVGINTPDELAAVEAHLASEASAR